ncbi:MAG: glycosyltransferase family 39 protein [Candidatus Eremiobacteraeota bacterium]|nr:glycosyltransferase family 39 protein [Candidatus Eremiobacteraeota bacterium]
MFKLFQNEKDRKYLLILIILMLLLKVLGSLFVNYYIKKGKMNQGLVYRSEKVMKQAKISPVIMALGYHWDSIHYVNISYLGKEHFKLVGKEKNFALRNFGYLFPTIIMILGWIFRSNILAGVIASNVFSILTIIAFYHVCRLYLSEEKSFAASALLMTYPAFFATGLITYSEPAYLFFAILSWYYFEKEDYLMSAVFTGMALCVRTSGAILLGIYFVCFLIRFIKKIKKEKRFSLPPAGCLYYLIPFILFVISSLITKRIMSSSDVIMWQDTFSKSIPSANSYFFPIAPSPKEQIMHFMGDTKLGLEMYMYILPAIFLGFHLKKINAGLLTYALIAIFSVMCIPMPPVIKAIPRHLLNAWPIFIAFGELIENRYFLFVICTFFFLGGIKTLEYYFTTCYI